VALSGSTALVGAHFDDIGTNENQGSSYVYSRSGSTWTQQAQLTASDGAANDQFGRSVALSGDTALVGAPFDDIVADENQGSAYVFTRSGSTWTLQDKLTPFDGEANDEFGSSVALSGNTALIGAFLDDVGANSNQGSAYVYTRSGSNWTQQAKLTAGDGAASDEFGFSAALSGDTALVGAHLDDTGRGSAYVYVRSGSAWTQQAKLAAGGSFAEFGHSVALSGDTALIGAWRASVGANLFQGLAFVYSRSGSTWPLQAVLLASDGDSGDGFGSSVALSGDTALVGASSDEVVANFGQGSAYEYSRSGSTWTEQAKLTASDGAANESFGDSIALSGNTALIGSPFNDGSSPFGNPNEGAAYVFIGLNLDNTTSTITADLPDPSNVGQSATISVVVTGTNTAPSAGTVTVNASTGESCIDDTLRVGGGTSSLYSCEIIFNTPGSRMLIASYSGSAAHAGSISLAEPHHVRQASSTVISAATPDPSQAGGTVPVSVSVSGALTAPADGQVTVQASTGESCNDTSSSAGAGSTVLFGCDLVFASVGPRTLTATFSGSTTHANSVSAAEPHMVVTTLIVAPASLPGGVFGAAYDQTLSASGTGSTAPYSFSVSNGALPSGLNLAAGSGQISGTATAAGSFTFTITATDSSPPAVGGPFTGSRTYTVQIARANQATLTVSATPPTILFDGTSALGTSGGSGTGAISFAATSGASVCSITGSTLTGIGVGTCTVTATKAADANFNAATANVQVTVQATTDLEVSILDDTTFAVPGGFSEYEILVANAGLLPVDDARVQHPVPAGLTAALWTCAQVQGASCPTASGIGGIDQLIDLPVNGVLRYVFSATVSASTGATIVSTATITTPAGMIELDPSDNQATDINSVVPNGVFKDGFENPAQVISVWVPPQ
ncbi:MAG: putative Ig domain-containing protein, partial [Pseudomarimonas sp.]